MARPPERDVRITLSVLDRLVDHEPDVSREPPASRSKSLRQLKQAVRRDLEWLLNTRQLLDGPLAEAKASLASVLTYGLPDFTGSGTRRPADQARLRRAVETAIRVFEPRLEDVVVVLEAVPTERLVRFRIEARLRVSPEPEPVVFDTELEVDRGGFQVRGA